MRFLSFSILFFLCLVLNAQREWTNEEIWYSTTFSSEYFSGLRSMNDGAHYTRLETDRSGQSIMKYSYSSGEAEGPIFRSSDVEDLPTISDYSFSANESKLLLATEMESIYRHSRKAHFFLYDLESKELSPLSDHDKGKVRLAEYSPDGSKVAFVRDNDLYYLDLSDGTETQVTDDGEMNSVINGATDWVYEEEFGFDKGYEWSKSGNFIAFYRFDESQVRTFQMAMYGGQLYPNQYTFKYPKAGERNADVSIHIHRVGTGMTQQVDLGQEEHYVPRIKWSDKDNMLCVMRMNRHQNRMELLMADANSARGPIITPYTFFLEENETYLEVTDNLIFMKDNSGFLMTSDRDGFNHIYHFDRKGKIRRQLTSGDWDVIEFEGFDTERNTVYFTSSEEGATEKNVYSVSVNSGRKQRLSPQDGYNQVYFSKGFNNYIISHSDANSPSDAVLYDSRGKKVRTLFENKALKDVLTEFEPQPKEFFSFTTERGDELNGWMIKPKDFDPTKKYPVLLAIYGGPGHNTVTNSFGGRNYYWHQLLASKGYIVASVDPRGTYYRGRDFKNSTYMQLGNLETEDMISAAKHLSSMKYIDGDRIGMQGWSFGGYLTSSCLMKGAEHFKMGIAVAPVTNWRYYDTIYTERFMRTPQENSEGYDDNSPLFFAEGLEDPYLLVHGSADDNVHYQNTMEMVDALVRANKPFDLFIYPDKNHGIYGGTTRLHLFEKMTRFIEENL